MFWVTSIGCKSQHKISEMIEKKVYKHDWNNGYSDIIEIDYGKDSSITGKYSGVHINYDSTMIFFFSKFISKNTDGVYDIVFELNEFKLSHEPFSLNKENKNEKSIYSDIPLVFTYPMTFLGKYSGNDLIIKKITGMEIMSGSYNMIFKKVNNE